MERLQDLLCWIRARQEAWRVPLLLLALAAFVIGIVVSVRHLALSPDDLRLEPLLLLALIFVPLSIAYSALNMMLMGRAAHVRFGFAQGIRVSVYAQVAELLPVPGGAIVRTAALMKAGAPGLRSTGLVLAFSLLWIACAACGAGVALFEQGWAARMLLLGGGIGVLAINAWLVRHFGWMTALIGTGLRIAGIGLVALRLAAAFAAVGTTISWIDSLTFAFATIAGSAAAIIPANLGVSEALSALLASPAGVAPAVAFLAAALSRLVGLAINGALALAFGFFGNDPVPEPAHG